MDASGGAAAATLFATAFDGGKLLSYSAAAGVRQLRAAPAGALFRGVALAPCTQCGPAPAPAPAAGSAGSGAPAAAAVAAGVLLPLAAVGAGACLLVRREGSVGAARDRVTRALGGGAAAVRAALEKARSAGGAAAVERGPLLARPAGQRLSPEQARARTAPGYGAA